MTVTVPVRDSYRFGMGNFLGLRGSCSRVR